MVVNEPTRTTAAEPIDLPGSPGRRRWLILVVIGLAQLMVTLDVTIVNIALPSAQHALGFSNGDRQWVITAYSLAFGSLLLLGGRLSDSFGRRWAFVIGLIGFAGASALGGAAQSFAMLVIARCVQGVFGALLAPAALSLLATTFTDERERGRAYGIYGAISGSGAAVGLLLGGALTDWLSWRWCLYVNLALATLALVPAMFLLRETRAPRRHPIDVPGTVTASAGLFSLVFGLSRAETNGWDASLTLVMLVSAAVFLSAFVTVQTRVTNPLLPLRVVLDRARAGSYLAIGIAGAGIFAIFLFLTYYLQGSLGYSPFGTGVAFLPMIGGIVLAATTGTSKVLPRTGPGPVVAVGMLVAAIGLALLTRVSVDTDYAAHVLPALVLAGLGFGMVMASAIATATRGIREADAGVGSALVTTMQQIGGSIAVALLSTFAADSARNFLASHRAPGHAVLEEAVVHGYHTAFGIAAVCFLCGAVVCGVLLPGGPRVPTDARS